MKIALLAHLKYPIRQPFAGGLEMHTHLLASFLRRRGHSVTLFAAEGSDPDLDVRAVAAPTGEPHGDAGLEAEIDRAEVKAYRCMMQEVAAGGFDVIHNNSLHFVPLAAAADLGVPMVTALHTPPFEPLAPAAKAARHCVSFVAVSRALSGQWKSVMAGVQVIPNGIDLSAFVMKDDVPRSRHAFWSGRIVPEKGLHLAIDAARHAGLPLRFAGPKLDEAYWKREIRPRLGADLTDLGHLPHADLARELSRASVAIVSPRWDEPFGLVVAESLACGTPVAAFARGAIPDLLDARCGALATPDDAQDLGRAIGVAVSRSRRACRSRAELSFDCETMTDRYEELYDRLVPGAVRPVALTRGRDWQTRALDPAEV